MSRSRSAVRDDDDDDDDINSEKRDHHVACIQRLLHLAKQSDPTD